MTEPSALGNAGMTLAGAGTGMNVVAKLLGADATKKQYLYQSGVAQINKTIMEQNAKWARDAGERENLIFGMKAGQRMGQIKAGQGASGLDVSGEGAGNVRSSQALVDRMDREQILDNAARRAYGYDVEAFNQGNKAKAYGMAAKNTEKAGLISAAASLVGGTTSVANKWYQGNTAGLWSKTDEDETFGGMGTAKSNRSWEWDIR